jgi:hypothetical protein
MISAAEARKLKDDIWQLQLEQIERGIKETIINGGTCIYYKTDKLCEETIEILRELGYHIYTRRVNSTWTDETEITWET